MTRAPLVSTWIQCFAPSSVAHSSGPKAQPSFWLRNLTPLTPLDPLGTPVSGAAPPCQLWPALSVRAIEVQM